MAAFSRPDFALDSLHQQETRFNMMPPLLEQEINILRPCFSSTFSPEYLHHGNPSAVQIRDSCHLELPTTTCSAFLNENLTSASPKTVDLEHVGIAHPSPVEQKRKHLDGENETDNRQNNASKRSRSKRLNSGTTKEKKIPEKPLTGYVHVRARRGEATDPHSLAERVRRKRISMRMKLLQSLVPGCDKITGKALILDEIIRYVLLLQHQVEFLAAKLASADGSASEVMNYHTNTLQQEIPYNNFNEVISSEFQESNPNQMMLLHHQGPIDASTILNYDMALLNAQK